MINMCKILKRLVLCILVIMIALAGINPSIIRAEENDNSEEEILGDRAPEDAPAYYEIEVSSRIISFGHVSKGKPVSYQALKVTSRSSETTYLDYQLSDAEDIFYISTRDSMSLAPGQSATFYIGLDENKPEGYYTATLILVPSDCIPATMNIGLSAEIVEDKPSISYIGIKPNNVDLTKNSTYKFSADVRGENNPDLGVIWSIDGNTSTNTTMDDNGNLRIGQNETASKITVRATSIQDSSWSAVAYANIKEGNYSVSTSSYPNNGGITSGGGTFSPGSNVEVVAAPNNGFRFTKWTRNGQTVSTNAKYAIKNLRENFDLVANFEQTNCYVKVNATHPEGGSISQSGNVNYNGSYTLKATPKAGFTFEGWYENGKRISDKNEYTIKNIVTNREFTANFVQNVFQVQLVANPQGAGIVAGAGSFIKGSKVSIAAKPVDGYEFDCWTVNNSLASQNANFTFTIDRDYVLVANFRKKTAVTYTLNSSVSGGQGAITPAGAISVPEGVDVTYSFAPAKNYTLSSVVVDGKNVGAVPNYTFKKVNGNHNISVKFAKIPDANVHTDKKEEKHEAIIDNKEVENTAVVDTEEEYKPNNVEDEVVDSFLEYTELTGILQEYNISENEARALIRNKDDMQLLEKACEEQYLAVSVVNEYADNKQETESASYMNLKSTPNFADVVDSLLTEDEKMDVFKGGKVAVNFNLFANNKLETKENKLLVNQAIKDKVEIGHFFEAILIKTSLKGDQVVTQLDVPMQIELAIPQELKADGREFLIMRAHKNDDGTVSIDYLPNESEDQSKIVFTTDRFSSYAIAYKGGKSITLTQSDYVKILFVAVAVAVILTIILIVLLIKINKRSRRRK